METSILSSGYYFGENNLTMIVIYRQELCNSLKYQKYYGYLRQKLSARLDFYSRFLRAFFLCFFLNFFAKGLPSFHPSTTVVRSRNSSENGFLSLQYAELESKSSRGVDTTTLWQTKCRVLLLSTHKKAAISN